MPPELTALFLLTGASSALTIAVVMYRGFPCPETGFTLEVMLLRVCRGLAWLGVSPPSPVRCVLNRLTCPRRRSPERRELAKSSGLQAGASFIGMRCATAADRD